MMEKSTPPKTIDRKFIVLIITVICFSLLAYFSYIVQVKIDAKHAALPSVVRKTEAFLPPIYLRILTLGYNQVLGDFIWLRAIQYIAALKETESLWLSNALNTISLLDPKFKEIYIIGGLWLSIITDMGEESNHLLQKGIKIYPEDWEIPFLIGFNNFYYFRDYKNAADYIARAAALPGSLPFLPLFAARLYAQARDPQLAVDFLYQLYQKAHDRKTKENLEKKLKETILERDFQLLEKAVDNYRRLRHRGPKSIQEMVRAKIIQEIPVEPFGGKYYLDKKGGVKTTTPIERYRFHEIQRPERIEKKYPATKK